MMSEEALPDLKEVTVVQDLTTRVEATDLEKMIAETGTPILIEET